MSKFAKTFVIAMVRYCGIVWNTVGIPDFRIASAIASIRTGVIGLVNPQKKFTDHIYLKYCNYVDSKNDQRLDANVKYNRI